MAKVTLTKEQVKRLNALNVSTKSDDAARKGIIDLLAQNDVDGMDDEDMDTLLDLAESLIPDAGAAAPAADDADAKELAQEAEEEAGEAEEETEEEEETAEGDEFDDMDRTALKKYIKENGLEVKVFKGDSDDDIRAKIRAALTAPAAEEEKEPEAPATKAAPAKKATAKPAAKKAEKAPTAKRGVKLDPQNNPDDLKVLVDAMSGIFPEDEFKYDAVKSAGVTIKHKGQNSNRALVLIENCSRQADGSIKCNLYFLTLTKNLEVLDNADIAYEKCWSGAPFIKGTTLAESVEMVSAVKDSLTAQVKKIDKRLGENRAKMEEGLAKKGAAKAKAEAKEETEAPAKPAAKAAAKPAKKTVKK